MSTTPNDGQPEFDPGAAQPRPPHNPNPNATPPNTTGQPYGPPPPFAQQQRYAPPPQYQPAQRPPRARLGVASLVAVAVIAAGIGGGAGAAVNQYFSPAGNEPAASATRVVQADASHPDWAATAAAVSDAVVAIQVVGPRGGGEGSGVILDGNGTIVTNNHVVSSAGPDAKMAVMIGDRVYHANVVGTDPSTDLAVIRLVDPPKNLTTITFGDSDKLRVGDPVMAIGNPLGLTDTVTTGIVSALNRPVTTRAVSNSGDETGSGVVVTAAIQTNAAINPGNSGGALVNSAGELVGITSSIASLTSDSSGGQAGNIGIGFAIPADQVHYVVDQLVEHGKVEHAQLGISVRDVVDSSLLGAEVERVVDGSAAAQAGLRPGDVIIAVDGTAVTSSESLVAQIRTSQVGQQVTLTVMRNGSKETLTATLTAASD